MRYIFSMCLLSSISLFSGFAGDILVKTPSGYIEIATLQVNDEICGIDKDGQVSITAITHTVSYESKSCLKIDIEQEQVVVGRGQKFFLPLKHVWRKAKKLHEQDPVLASFFEAMTVQKLEKLKKPIRLYEIRLKDDHAFLITKSDIIVHNCPLFQIGVLITRCGGKFVIEQIIFGVCFVGAWIGPKICCGSSKKPEIFAGPKAKGCNHAAVHQNQKYLYDDLFMPADSPLFYQHEAKGGCNVAPSRHSPDISCGARTCNPPRYGPNGCHIPSDKHGSKPKGNIAAGLNMEEGQKALDISVPVKGKKQRVAVWKGQYIVFEPTSKDIWHNHIRPWDDEGLLDGLTEGMKAALKQAGVVKGAKGKIIKDAK